MLTFLTKVSGSALAASDASRFRWRNRRLAPIRSVILDFCRKRQFWDSGVSGVETGRAGVGEWDPLAVVLFILHSGFCIQYSVFPR